MTVSIDWSRAETVCGQLLAAYRTRTYPYGEDWALPQTFIPPAIREDPLVHSQFLFCCCHYMRGTIKSDHAVKQLIKMWEKYPEYFIPEYVQGLNDLEELERVLGSYIGYKKSEMAMFWRANLSRLADHWQSDPRRLFDGEMTSELMYERIRSRPLSGKQKKRGGPTRKGFYGFQKKMASMLAYFLMDANLVPSFTASPPVDFHLVRVLLATGVLVPAGRDNGRNYRYDHFEPLGVEVLEKYAHTHDVSLVEIGNALWMLSVVLCSRAPGNRSSAVERDENGKKVYPVPIPVDWDNGQDVQRYLQTCDRCPVKDHCAFNVYAGPYYQAGEFIFLPRVRNPTVRGDLFGSLRAQVSPRALRPRSELLKIHEARQSARPTTREAQSSPEFDFSGKDCGDSPPMAPEE